jgi:hypothetical protein
MVSDLSLTGVIPEIILHPAQRHVKNRNFEHSNGCRPHRISLSDARFQDAAVP